MFSSSLRAALHKCAETRSEKWPQYYMKTMVVMLRISNLFQIEREKARSFLFIKLVGILRSMGGAFSVGLPHLARHREP